MEWYAGRHSCDVDMIQNRRLIVRYDIRVFIRSFLLLGGPLSPALHCRWRIYLSQTVKLTTNKTLGNKLLKLRRGLLAYADNSRLGFF